MTHKELVKRAGKWLRDNRHSVLAQELVTYNSETPDAIGFMGGGIGTSTLIECKTSRSDFLADRKKRCRQAKQGMGDRRYFMAPEGMIGVEELPCGWGLLEVDGNQIKETKKAVRTEGNKKSEIVLLMSLIRRAKLRTRE